MNPDTLMLYKLMILYTLSRVNFPLTNGQLTVFILEKGYTNYFNIQQVISQLLDDNFISVETIRNSSLYRISETGLETLRLFDHIISQGIKDDIENYLKDNKYELREEVSTLADYYQIKKGKFGAHLSVIERSTREFDSCIKNKSLKALLWLYFFVKFYDFYVVWCGIIWYNRDGGVI